MRDENVLAQMVTGYPRFLIHKTVERLAQGVLKSGVDGDRALKCAQYIKSQESS